MQLGIVKCLGRVPTARAAQGAKKGPKAPLEAVDIVDSAAQMRAQNLNAWVALAQLLLGEIARLQTAMSKGYKF